MKLLNEEINLLDKSKPFIIDEDTYHTIINNNNYQINDIKYQINDINDNNDNNYNNGNNYNNKIIIRYFAECCYEFEDEICNNMKTQYDIYLPESNNNSVYLFFDNKRIIDFYKVKSSYDFINSSIKNIFLNNSFCNNMYFYVYHSLTNGNKFETLDNNKEYIKVYIDLKPNSVDLFFKKDRTRFLYK